MFHKYAVIIFFLRLMLRWGGVPCERGYLMTNSNVGFCDLLPISSAPVVEMKLKA
jgi:NADH:ubiquinone oxidoreductase subunit H